MLQIVLPFLCYCVEEKGTSCLWAFLLEAAKLYTVLRLEMLQFCSPKNRSIEMARSERYSLGLNAA